MWVSLERLSVWWYITSQHPGTHDIGLPEWFTSPRNKMAVVLCERVVWPSSPPLYCLELCTTRHAQDLALGRVFRTIPVRFIKERAWMELWSHDCNRQIKILKWQTSHISFREILKQNIRRITIFWNKPKPIKALSDYLIHRDRNG